MGSGREASYFIIRLISNAMNYFRQLMKCRKVGNWAREKTRMGEQAIWTWRNQATETCARFGPLSSKLVWSFSLRHCGRLLRWEYFREANEWFSRYLPASQVIGKLLGFQLMQDGHRGRMTASRQWKQVQACHHLAPVSSHRNICTLTTKTTDTTATAAAASTLTVSAFRKF